MIPRVGAPHAWPCDPPRSFDCWAVVLAVREHYGRATRLSVDPALVPRDGLPDAVREELSGGRWAEVAAGELCDVVIFSPTDRHCGVFVSPKLIMHCAPGVGVQVARLSAVQRRYPLMRILRQ